MANRAEAFAAASSLAYWEAGCWIALVLTPIVYYLNGPAVSGDQLLVRATLVVLVGVGTAALRLCRWRKNRLATAGRGGNGPDALVADSETSRAETRCTPWTSAAREKRIRTAVVSLLLVVHGLLLCIQAWRNAPTFDEPAHLASGLFHWGSGNFDLYRVNPPLVRLLATSPLLVVQPKGNWSIYSNNVFDRLEFSAGYRFLEANGVRSLWYFTLARWTVVPVILLGAWAAHRWAVELYGWVSGLLALSLWCFCPNLLAWGSQITPDAAAASLGVLANWLFWRWLRHPGWKSALLAGVGLGLAELAKASWIILFGLWPMLWLVWRISIRKSRLDRPRAVHFAIIVLVAVYLINAGYGFEATCQRLDQFTFISKTLAGNDAYREGGNRFAGSLIGWIRVPVPANYLRGIDVQKRDFEDGRWSYLRGEQKKGGWWYYYLYGLLIKTPLGFLLLFVVAVLLGITHCEYRSPWRDETVLLLPAFVLLVLVSSQTGFNRHIRYVIPALPFLFIAVARLGRAWELRHGLIRVTCIAGLVAGVVSSLAIFPYSISYFNCLVGGPIGGKWHLLDANLDWGQDLLELKDWLRKHPASEPIRLAYFGILEPQLAGIDYELVRPAQESAGRGQPAVPAPGWYAISVNRLMGYHHLDRDTSRFAYFQTLKPAAMIGYSIYVYHIESRPGTRQSP